MNKTEILRELKNKIGVASLKLPKYIQIEEQDGVVTLLLEAIEKIKATKETKGQAAHGVTANMQSDDAAFEGWASCIRAVNDKWKICLNWGIPQNKNSGHYQRFLYRVKKFESYYNDWFSIVDERRKDLLDLCIRDDESDTKYLLNSPSLDRGEEIPTQPESRIEKEIILSQPAALRTIFEIERLDRQLPVGIFKNRVTTENAIFTHGTSAVDIWGISKNEDLVIFELKAPGNDKVGAISELFFYSMVLVDEQDGNFARDHDWGKIIQSTNSLKSMILAENTHPLITESVFDLLNAPFKTDNRIQFGFIEMPPTGGFNKIF